MDLLRRLGIGAELKYGGRGLDASAGEAAATDHSSTPEQIETEGATMETEEVAAPVDNPEIAKRAAYWGKKYVEDRTKSIEERTKIVQYKLMGEFPTLDRKAARAMATHITREW